MLPPAFATVGVGRRRSRTTKVYENRVCTTRGYGITGVASLLLRRYIPPRRYAYTVLYITYLHEYVCVCVCVLFAATLGSNQDRRRPRVEKHIFIIIRSCIGM